MTRLNALAVLVLGLSPLVAHAEPVGAPGLDRAELAKMDRPAIIDLTPANVAAGRMERGLEALERMVGLVGDRKEQRVLRRQIADLKAQLGLLQDTLEANTPVRPFVPQKKLRPDVRLPLRPVAIPPPMVDHKPMSAGRFASFLQSVDEGSFSKDKLGVVESVAPQNHFSAPQIRAVLDKLAFSKDKVKAFRVLYPQLLGDEGHTLLSAFAHSSDRKKVRAIMAEVDAQ